MIFIKDVLVVVGGDWVLVLVCVLFFIDGGPTVLFRLR